MGHLACLLNPATCVATHVGATTLGDFFDALTTWIIASVQWFLSACGHVLNSASDPATILRSANEEYGVLVALAAPLMMLGLLVATLDALRHGDAASLWRVYLGVAPGAVLAIALARPLATLVLEAVDQLSSGAAATVVTHEHALTSSLLSMTTTTPGFVLFVMALGVVAGTWLLWCELIVRSVVLTLLIVLVPVVVPLVTLPAARRLGARLAETFLAVAASKFLIVVTLSLGLDELRGSSPTQVVTGAVTLLLAAATPFVLLRVIPFIEQSALHQLDGVRARLTRGATGLGSTPVVAAARAMMPEESLPGPPERTADLGLAMWESDHEVTMPAPPDPDERLAPPIGTPSVRTGHVAYHLDKLGPVVGWHFDE